MDKNKIINEVERRYELNKIVVILAAFFLIVEAVILILASKSLFNYIVASLLFIGFIVCLVVNFKTWRCPKCNKNITQGREMLSYPKFCQHCGVQIKN